jgi:hypothetical protein
MDVDVAMEGEGDDEFIDCVPNYWPCALRKAVNHRFIYAAGLRDIGIVTFEHAELSWCSGEEKDSLVANAEWVTLTGVRTTSALSGFDPQGHDLSPSRFTFDRGIEVRVSQILWVAESPWGDLPEDIE